MKVLVLIVFSIISGIELPANSEGFFIQGKIEGVINGNAELFLVIGKSGFEKIAQAPISNGSFSLSGKVPHPVMCYLNINGGKVMPLFVENDTIFIEANINQFNNEVIEGAVSGSASQKEYESYLKQKKEADKSLNRIYDQYDQALEKGDTVTANQLLKKYQINYKFTEHYIATHPNSYVSAYLIYEGYMWNKYDSHEIANLVTSLTGKAKNTIYAKELHQE